MDEIRYLFRDLNDRVKFLNYPVREPISVQVEDVILEKVLMAYKEASVPVIVEHGALEIKYLNKFPGALSKPMWDLLGGRICDLIPADKDRAAYACSAVGYCDGFRRYSFVKRVLGTVAKTPRGSGGFQWDPIFIPNGESQTYAEMTRADKLKLSQAAKAYEALRDYLGLGPLPPIGMK